MRRVNEGVKRAGTVRQLTNATGAVTDAYEYDAYGNVVNGNVVNRTGSTPNEMLYRGEQYDSDPTLCYFGATSAKTGNSTQSP